MNDRTKPSIHTEAIHAGEERGRFADSLTTPIFQTSTYTFKNSDEIEAYTSKNSERFEYGRYGNPTQETAEKRLAALENTEDCLLFASGMSAITTAILSFVKSGDHIILTDDSYKKTLEFCNSYLQRFGIECTVVPFGDYDRLESSIKSSTRLILSESPTNPYLNVFDLKKLKKIAERHDILTLIDSTFATPYNQKPSDFGIDIVIHSATKYLGGHNDIMAGAVLGSNEMIAPVRHLHKSMGGIINPHTAYLLIRGLKTFTRRMKHQNDAALFISQYLEKHPKVSKVYYPYLESHRHYTIAKEQMAGGGGVVSFQIKGDIESAKKFMNSLQMIYIGPSLGGVETLITHPALVSYYYYSAEERRGLGILDNLFRIAVGLEDVDDIINDLERGFAGI